MNDHELCLSNEREIAYLRDLFQSEINRVDKILEEREKQANDHLAEALRARAAANEWREALVQRERTYTRVEAHARLEEQVDRIALQQHQSQGRRAAWIAAAGIIATLLAIGVGQILRQGITAGDVSQQIQREAPWNRDKEQVERRIEILEGQITRHQVEIARIKSDLRAHQILDVQRDRR